LFVGAIKVNCAEFAPVATTFEILGTLGTVGANSGLDADDESEAPLLLMATTLNVYEFPGVRPVIFAALIRSGVNVAVISPGLDLTRYEITREPPSSSGAPILSIADPNIPISTDLIDGDPGGPRGRCHNAVL
jgi:hypothetical protein